MSKLENYRLQLSDFTPFIGPTWYHDRNKDSLVDIVGGRAVKWSTLTDEEKRIKKGELFLFGYNAFFYAFTPVFVAAAIYTAYINHLINRFY